MKHFEKIFSRKFRKFSQRWVNFKKIRNLKIDVTGKPSKSKEKLSGNRSRKIGFRGLTNLSGVLKYTLNVS